MIPDELDDETIQAIDEAAASAARAWAAAHPETPGTRPSEAEQIHTALEDFSERGLAIAQRGELLFAAIDRYWQTYEAETAEWAKQKPLFKA